MAQHLRKSHNPMREGEAAERRRRELGPVLCNARGGAWTQERGEARRPTGNCCNLQLSNWQLLQLAAGYVVCNAPMASQTSQ
jgi:hypothetical protein